MASEIQSFKLQGHQGPVTCLDHTSSLTSDFSLSACLLSGSEDGSARLFDLREYLRAAMCIKTPSLADGEQFTSEILSVCFGSTSQPTTAALTESAFARDLMVYVAAGSVVYQYDLRMAGSPIVALQESDILFHAEDDVNHISRSGTSNRGRSCHLALADDAGHVTIVEEGRMDSSVDLIHDEQALVTSAVFRPNHYKTCQIASGGTDCTICLWDIAKARKAIDRILIPSLSTDANQVCNPPMINSLAWSPSGRLLGAALGDGTCGLFSVSNNRSLLMTSRLEDAHSGPVASVLFPKWNRMNAAQDRLFCSVGNDGYVVLWDLGSALCGDQEADPNTLFPSLTSSDTDDDMLGQPKTLFAWQHLGGKPNWTVSSCGRDASFPSALFLCDTSNDIIAYNLRLA